MKKKIILHSSLLSCLFALMAGCSADSEGPEGDWTERNDAEAAPISFDEYRNAARQSVDGHEVFVVEGDMMFETEDALRSYYDDLYVNTGEKSIINVVDGERDTRPNPLNIRYCFVAGWGEDQGSYTPPALAGVRTNIQAAMANWQGIAGVKFTYVSLLDGAACNTSGANPGVDFVVAHWSDPDTAIGPFPSNSWSNQKLLVPTSGIGRLLAVHELGHTLGFRHEHIHSGATPRCDESGTREELTEFDTLSVMKYSNCTSGQTINGTELSALDRVGAHKVYGATVRDSLYIVQNGGLWRTDNDDGIFKQAGSADWSGATSTTRLGDYIYIVQNSRLHQVTPWAGSFTVLGSAAWAGSTTMAAINGALYITQNSRLYKITNLTTGAYSQVGTADWSDATSMAALGASLYIVQNSRLHKVNPSNGSYTVLGGATWAGSTTMAAINGALYITRNPRLYKITNLTTGAYSQVGTADWSDATSMTALGSSLYIVQNSRLHKVNPSNGSYTVLGGAAWAGPTVMTAVP